MVSKVKKRIIEQSNWFEISESGSYWSWGGGEYLAGISILPDTTDVVVDSGSAVGELTLSYGTDGFIGAFQDIGYLNVGGVQNWTLSAEYVGTGFIADTDTFALMVKATDVLEVYNASYANMSIGYIAAESSVYMNSVTEVSVSVGENAGYLGITDAYAVSAFVEYFNGGIAVLGNTNGATLYSFEGDALVVGYMSNDMEVITSIGNDTVSLSEVYDAVVATGSGNDHVDFTNVYGIVLADDGDDSLYVYGGEVGLNPGAGNDSLYVSGGHTFTNALEPYLHSEEEYVSDVLIYDFFAGGSHAAMVDHSDQVYIQVGNAGLWSAHFLDVLDGSSGGWEADGVVAIGTLNLSIVTMGEMYI